MCSIFASFDKKRLKDLAVLNQFRGNFSYSVTQDRRTLKGFGDFNNDDLDTIAINDDYIIGHVQAPTGGMIKDLARVHPTEGYALQSLLWHNGLLTPRGIRYLQESLDTTEEFDTKLLHLHLIKNNFAGLGEIEGLFTCMFQFANEIYVFRTKHGKLYVDDDLNISSERFDNSKCINYDTVYRLNMVEKKLDPISKFKTKRFNYIIEGEMND